MPRRRFLPTFLAILIVICFGALSFSAQAQDRDQQPQGAQPTLSQSATDTFDTIHLRSGGLYRGRVTEIVPDDHVLMITEAGETKRFVWAEIARIVTSTVPSASPPPPPTPPRPPPVASTTPPLETTPPPTSTTGPPQSQTQWRANRPLLVTGAILFAAGYGPNVIAGAPSTLGLLGRVVLLVLTVGLPCLFNNGDDYLCHGEHGAMQLLIPFAGPIIFANDHPHDSVLNESGSPLSSTAKGLLVTSSVVQIAGVTSILSAIVFGAQEPIPQRKGARTDLLPSLRAGKNGPPIHIAPLAAPNAVGISVGIHHWAE